MIEICEHKQLANLFGPDMVRVILSSYLESEWVEDATHFFSEEYGKIKRQYYLAARLDAVCLLTRNIPNDPNSAFLGDDVLQPFGADTCEYFSLTSFDDSDEKKSGDFGVRSAAIVRFENDSGFLTDVLGIAAKYDSVNIIQYFLDHYFRDYQASQNYRESNIPARGSFNPGQYGGIAFAKPTLTTALDIAAENGSLRCVKLLLSKLLFYHQSTVVLAAKGGHRNIMEFLKQYRYKETMPWYSDEIECCRIRDALHYTAGSGNIDLLRWIMTTNNEDGGEIEYNIPIEQMFCSAVENGYMKMVQHLAIQYPEHPQSDAPLIAAIKKGYLEIFFFLHNRLTSPITDPGLLLAAVEEQDIDTFRFLRSEGTGKGVVSYETLPAPGFAIPMGGGGWPAPLHHGVGNITEKITIKVIKNKDVEFAKHLIQEEKADVQFFQGTLYKLSNSSVKMIELFENTPVYKHRVMEIYHRIFYGALQEGNKELIWWFLRKRQKELEEKKEQLNNPTILPGAPATCIHGWLIHHRLFKILEFIRDPQNGFDFIEENINETHKLFNELVFADMKYVKKLYADHPEYKDTLPEFFYQTMLPYMVLPSTVAESKFAFGTEIAPRNLYDDLPEDLRIPHQPRARCP
jgi:hypothetical protein